MQQPRPYSLLESLDYYSDTLGRLALTDPREVGETASRILCSCLGYGASLVVFELADDGVPFLASKGFEADRPQLSILGRYLLQHVDAPQTVQGRELPAEAGAVADVLGMEEPLLCAPLRGSDSGLERKLGVLAVARPPRDGRQDLDLQALDTLGGFISGALVTCAVHQRMNAEIERRKRVETELRRSRRRLELVNSIARDLRTDITATQTIERAVSELRRAFPDLRTTYATLDERGLLTLLSERPAIVPSVEEGPIDLTVAPAYFRSLRSREPIMIEDVRIDTRTRPIAERMELAKTRAILDVSLQHSRNLIGLLSFHASLPRRWSAHEAAVLLEVSEFLGVALKHTHDREQRELAEQENAMLEIQLLQAQKMEAIGRLAGGVAHDFNNLLMAISGYNEMILDELKPHSSLHHAASAILDATRKATSLTRQLLTFSRKQLIQPESVDLGRLITNIKHLLGPMIGESIELRTETDRSPSRVWADAGQIEQVMMNLAVNARDAMPGGGEIVIKTEDVTLDVDEATRISGLERGRFVKLSVSDSGCGMSPEIRSQIFEPFFTTKEKGKGTGLGLSTVYGIVKQNAGAIDVISEPGGGTTFEIYLPEFTGHRLARPKTEVPSQTQSGTETILLVEDDPPIRNLVERFLGKCGYRVLKASDGEEALRVAEDEPNVIDLLITDVVMPGLNGRELADYLTERYRGLSVIYISGFTDDVIGGTPEPTRLFVQKPFTLSMLASKTRQALDSKRAGLGLSPERGSLLRNDAPPSSDGGRRSRKDSRPISAPRRSAP